MRKPTARASRSERSSRWKARVRSSLRSARASVALSRATVAPPSRDHSTLQRSASPCPEVGGGRAWLASPAAPVNRTVSSKLERVAVVQVERRATSVQRLLPLGGNPERRADRARAVRPRRDDSRPRPARAPIRQRVPRGPTHPSSAVPRARTGRRPADGRRRSEGCSVRRRRGREPSVAGGSRRIPSSALRAGPRRAHPGAVPPSRARAGDRRRAARAASSAPPSPPRSRAPSGPDRPAGGARSAWSRRSCRSTAPRRRARRARSRG